MFLHRMAALGAAAAASFGGGADRPNGVVAAPTPVHARRQADDSLVLLANRILAGRRRSEASAGPVA